MWPFEGNYNADVADEFEGVFNTEHLADRIRWVNYQLDLRHRICLNLTAISSLTSIPFFFAIKKRYVSSTQPCLTANLCVF